MYKKGFSLAETLTVLGIIGVIAAMTMPVLYNNTKNVQRMSTLKKMYTKMNTNIQKVLVGQEQNSGNICDTLSCLRVYKNESAATDPIAHNGILVTFRDDLGIKAECMDCMRTSQMSSPSDPSAPPVEEFVAIGDLPSGFDVNKLNFSIYQLFDDSIIAIQDYPGNCIHTLEGLDDSTTAASSSINLVSLCGVILFDVNGVKSPNTAGKDRFAFYVADKSVRGSFLIPLGYNSPDISGFNETAEIVKNGWRYSER